MECIATTGTELSSQLKTILLAPLVHDVNFYGLNLEWILPMNGLSYRLTYVKNGYLRRIAPNLLNQINKYKNSSRVFNVNYKECNFKTYLKQY